MGINYLHDTVKPTIEGVSFNELCIAEGFQTNRHGLGVLRVGFDAPLWLESISHGKNLYHQQKGMNAECKELFRRLGALLNFPVVPVFIFDGPNRPSLKRGKNVIPKAHWLTEPFKKWIDAFGFHHHQAPGEAEAELSYLNRIGRLDLIITEDSDAIVFGAPAIGRGLDLKVKSPSLTLCLRSRISQELDFSHGGLVLFALVAGGDYNPTGIPGCGKGVASGLARTSLGDDLAHAYVTLPPEELLSYLVEWRKRLVHELKTNASGHLPHTCSSIATKVPAVFPDAHHLALYLSPLVSATIPEEWIPRAPNMLAILKLYPQYFLTDTEEQMKDTFVQSVLRGLYIQRVVHSQKEWIQQSCLPDVTDVLTVKPVASKTKSIDRTPFYNVRVDITRLVNTYSVFSTALGSKTIKIAAPLINAACPQLVRRRKRLSLANYHVRLPIPRSILPDMVDSASEDGDGENDDGKGDSGDDEDEDEDSDEDEDEDETDKNKVREISGISRNNMVSFDEETNNRTGMRSGGARSVIGRAARGVIGGGARSMDSGGGRSVISRSVRGVNGGGVDAGGARRVGGGGVRSMSDGDGGDARNIADTSKGIEQRGRNLGFIDLSQSDEEVQGRDFGFMDLSQSDDEVQGRDLGFMDLSQSDDEVEMGNTERDNDMDIKMIRSNVVNLLD